MYTDFTAQKLATRFCNTKDVTKRGTSVNGWVRCFTAPLLFVWRYIIFWNTIQLLYTSTCRYALKRGIPHPQNPENRAVRRRIMRVCEKLRRLFIDSYIRHRISSSHKRPYFIKMRPRRVSRPPCNTSLPVSRILRARYVTFRYIPAMVIIIISWWKNSPSNIRWRGLWL